jgi:hypothetical protein
MLLSTNNPHAAMLGGVGDVRWRAIVLEARDTFSHSLGCNNLSVFRDLVKVCYLSGADMLRRAGRVEDGPMESIRGLVRRERCVVGAKATTPSYTVID